MSNIFAQSFGSAILISTCSIPVLYLSYVPCLTFSFPCLSVSDLWSAGNSGCRRHCPAVCPAGRSGVCLCSHSDSGTDDACFYKWPGTDCNRYILSAVYECGLSVLGCFGSLSGHSAQHRQSCDQHSFECTGIFTERICECHIYFWSAGRAETGRCRCRHCHLSVQMYPAHWLFPRIPEKQICETGLALSPDEK